jgi:predicted benzoate:H+ symporter BenE
MTNTLFTSYLIVDILVDTGIYYLEIINLTSNNQMTAWDTPGFAFFMYSQTYMPLAVLARSHAM